MKAQERAARPAARSSSPGLPRKVSKRACVRAHAASGSGQRDAGEQRDAGRPSVAASGAAMPLPGRAAARRSARAQRRERVARHARSRRATAAATARKPSTSLRATLDGFAAAD